MPQRQDRLQMFQSMWYHATHARTHVRRCAEARAISHAGVVHFLLAPYVCIPTRALRIFFLFLFFLFLSRSRRDFFAATRPRNLRFPRKISLSQWRPRISYSSVMYVFLNIDAPHVRCVECKIQMPRRFIREGILKILNILP